MGDKITVKEAAESLGVGVVTIRRYIHGGKLRAFKVSGRGNILLVERSAVESLSVPVIVPAKSKRRK